MLARFIVYTLPFAALPFLCLVTNAHAASDPMVNTPCPCSSADNPCKSDWKVVQKDGKTTFVCIVPEKPRQK